MKTRNGFVSNSSSSSFVVRRYKDGFTRTPTKLLQRGDEAGLKKLGFRLQLCYYPDQVSSDDPVADATENVIGKKLRAELLKHANWVKAVSCNQDDEIAMLLKARLSFTADIHYGHYSMVYDGPSDVLLVAQNFGKQIQMAGDEKMTFASKSEVEPVQRTTGKKYLKTHKL